MQDTCGGDMREILQKIAGRERRLFCVSVCVRQRESQRWRKICLPCLHRSVCVGVH